MQPIISLVTIFVFFSAASAHAAQFAPDDWERTPWQIKGLMYAFGGFAAIGLAGAGFMGYLGFGGAAIVGGGAGTGYLSSGSGFATAAGVINNAVVRYGRDATHVGKDILARANNIAQRVSIEKLLHKDGVFAFMSQRTTNYEPGIGMTQKLQVVVNRTTGALSQLRYYSDRDHLKVFGDNATHALVNLTRRAEYLVNEAGKRIGETVSFSWEAAQHAQHAPQVQGMVRQMPQLTTRAAENVSQWVTKAGHSAMFQ